MILKGLDKLPFDFTQFAVVMLLVVIAILFEYVKEQFVAEYRDIVEPSNSASQSSMSVRKGYAHTFYQN
jgi:hypothetical protein